MIDIIIDYIYWALKPQGAAFLILVTVILYVSVCIYKSMSVDVERLSLKITNSTLSILLTWGTVVLSVAFVSLLMLDMEFPFVGRYRINARVGSVIFIAIIPPLAFWYFQRAVICCLCYIIAKCKNRDAKFFSEDGFRWIFFRR